MIKDRPTALGRLHALWALEALDALDSDSMMLGLSDPEPRVREQAIRLTEPRLARDPVMLRTVCSLTADPDRMVRFQLAFSLGAANNEPSAIAALASIAIRDLNSPWIRTAVLSSIGGRPLALFEALTKRTEFLTNPASQAWLDELAFLVGSERKAGDVDELLRRLPDAGAPSETSIRVVLALARGRERSGGSFQDMLDASKAEASERLASILAEAVKAARSDGPLDRRQVAIRLVGSGDAKTARELFPTLLDARQPNVVQLTVLQALAGLLDRDTAEQVLAHWRSMSPAVRREAVEVLLGRTEGITAVIEALESRAMASSELDPDRLAQLRTHPDVAIRTRARKVLAGQTSAARDRGQIIATYRPALTLEGNREEGRAVYVKICATCHQAEGHGVAVGPNLATVAGRSTEDLLVHILDPNREVAPNYLNYNVATDRGRVVSGIIAEESATALVLKRAEGAVDVIPRAKIEAITSTGVSLMPEGLEKGLSSQDIANLIAFLRSIRPSTGAIAPPAKAN